MKIFALLVFALIVSGCSSNVWLYNSYSKPGLDNAQFNADLLECRAMSKRLVNDDDDNYTTGQCMQSRGYSVTRKSRPFF